jgi:hypothetical protein
LWIARTMIGFESSSSRTRYFAVGIGQRYFLNSSSGEISSSSQSDMISLRPNWSYYLGWDGNLSQLLIIPFGTVLASYATSLEAGGVAGLRKIFSNKLAFDFQVGFGYGMSISNNNLSSQLLRFMAGLTYYM